MSCAASQTCHQAEGSCRSSSGSSHHSDTATQRFAASSPSSRLPWIIAVLFFTQHPDNAWHVVLCCTLQLYSVALYVEGELAAKELGIRYRGGFFENDDDYCSALVDGAFEKVLVVSDELQAGSRICLLSSSWQYPIMTPPQPANDQPVPHC